MGERRRVTAGTCDAVKEVGALSSMALSAANKMGHALDDTCVCAKVVTKESNHAFNESVCNSHKNCMNSAGATALITCYFPPVISIVYS